MIAVMESIQSVRYDMARASARSVEKGRDPHGKTSTPENVDRLSISYVSDGTDRKM